MTIKNIAFKNIKGNLNKYVMYYLSNVIVVTIFFIFANFIFNPSINNVNKGNGNMGALAANIMYLCEFVIVIFTFVFSNYSISNFLKSREKEFGLLSMFGLTKNQIRGYVMLENIIIAVASIITGLLFGILFSKVFFLAVAAILNLDAEIPFVISFKAVYVTVLCFLIIFQLISFITSFKIKNSNIAQLLKGARVAKPVPKFSKIKAALSIVLIAAGYVIALYSHAMIIFSMFPILLIVIIGTYFLFSQFSVFFTERLQKNKLVYYKGINLITLSQIIYKLRDNAKVLFITSILSGITLAASLSVYSLEKVALYSLDTNCPQDIGILEQEVNSHNVIRLEDVETIFKKYKFDIQHKNKIELIKAENADSAVTDKSGPYGIKINTTEFNIMSQSSYNVLEKQYHKKTVNLKKGDIIVYTYDLISGFGNETMKLPFKDKRSLSLIIGGKKSTWNIVNNIKGGIINQDNKATNTIVVNDEDFKKLSQNAASSEKIMYYGYNIKNNMKASNAVKEIKNLVTKGQENYFIERVISAAALLQVLSVLLFIGTFVSIIFFIATGSILYFKMFNEIQKDKQEFIALRKLGITRDEIKKVVSTQSLTIFFLPFIIAMIHAAFAVKSLGLLYTSYFAVISGIYLLLQCVYYFLAKWMYTKQINSWEM